MPPQLWLVPGAGLELFLEHFLQHTLSCFPTGCETQRIFSLCCQDLATDVFTRPTKQGNQIVPFLCYLLGLGGTKWAAIFGNTTSGKLRASWEGGALAAKEGDGMGGCSPAAFLCLFWGVIGILC